MFIEFTITPVKITICLLLALVTTIIVRFALGNKRDLWFARSQQKSLITQRGLLGYYLALGYPICKEGYLVLCALLLFIALEVVLVLCLNFA